MRIAILEDDIDQAAILTAWLEADGKRVASYNDAPSFKRAIKRDSFDLIILDWELPQSSGLEVLCWLRDTLEWPVPVIFTTLRQRECDLVEALDKGADDFITKPISRQTLLARIGAILRRHQHSGQHAIETYGDYQFDRERQIVFYHNKNINMSGKEFDLAFFLFKNKGRLVSRDHILEAVWGSHAALQTRKVDTYVSRIRSKLSRAGETQLQIVSVYQRGYRLENVDE